MTLKSRLLGLVLVFALTGTLVAAEPVKLTPEQAVAARRMAIRNGSFLSVHYRTDDLAPLDAVAYRRLEFIENKVELNQDVQGLARLQVRNNVQAELYHTRKLAAVTSNGAACYDTTDVALQNFAQLEQAYQDVLNIERLRQGLPLMRPAVPAAAAPVPVPVVVTVVAPAVGVPVVPAAPAPATPAPATPAPAARAPVTPAPAVRAPVTSAPVARAPAAVPTVNTVQMVANMMNAARLINASGPVAAAPVTPAPAPRTFAPQMHMTETMTATPAPTPVAPATETPVAAFFGGMALRGLLAIGSFALLFMVR